MGLNTPRPYREFEERSSGTVRICSACWARLTPTAKRCWAMALRQKAMSCCSSAGSTAKDIPAIARGSTRTSSAPSRPVRAFPSCRNRRSRNKSGLFPSAAMALQGRHSPAREEQHGARREVRIPVPGNRNHLKDGHRETRTHHRHHRAGRRLSSRSSCFSRAIRSSGVVRRSQSTQEINNTRLRWLGVENGSRAATMATSPNSSSLIRLVHTVQPDEIYNLARSLSFGSSWHQPMLTAQVTAIGVLNVLEAIRQSKPDTRFYQASSSEMYGLIQEPMQRETTPFYPRCAVCCGEALWPLDHGELS